MLNILPIKELLRKPVEIQWNVAGTLPGKLKRNILGAFSYKTLPPKIKKMLEMAIFGGLGTNVEFQGFLWFYEFLKVSVSIFQIKTVLTSS